MRVLVVGSGGREHAICWSLAASPRVSALFCSPGNPGMEGLATRVPIGVDDLDGLCRFAKTENIELVVVGPEMPLVAGLVDRLEAAGIRAFGPSAAAARLEGSKAFMKEFAARHGIPTAAHRSFGRTERDEAVRHIESRGFPVVVKADGLAAGKGVVVAASRTAAVEALDAAFGGTFGDAGTTVVIEEFLEGEEASLFAICDGETALEIGTAQDHKRAFDGDQGPNTGGMGAYSPAPLLDEATVGRVMNEIIRPTLAGMAAEGSPFKGFLYAGLMIGPHGPRLVEFNVRFGDPECQVVLPRLETDLAELLLSACEGRLGAASLSWRPRHALTVVMATRGYPAGYEKGSELAGLDHLKGREGVLLFHAGTSRADDRWIATGGRVLAVTGLGTTLEAAHAVAYDAVSLIDWPEGFYRSDIGRRALDRAAGR